MYPKKNYNFFQI